jgi:hypothetical protein
LLGGRVRLIVHSRDRTGRPRSAAGVFKAELDFAG